MLSIADSRGQTSQSVGGRLGCGETKAMAAGKAAVVIEDTTVDEFAQSGTGQTTGRAADHGAKERTEDTAEDHARRTGDDADGHADFDAGQAASSTTNTAADRADQAGSLAGTIAGGDPRGIAVGTGWIHRFPLSGLSNKREDQLKASL